MRINQILLAMVCLIVATAGTPLLLGPNGLMRRGWTRNSLKIGDVITVTGWLAKNAPHVGNASTVTLSNGKKVFAGSSAESETNP